MKKYNNKYTNVFYQNNEWRCYDENLISSLEALHSEIQIKLIELVEKYNFKIFYFKCSPLNQYKIFIDDQIIDLSTLDIKKIKDNQESDFYYLYESRVCEIFYSFLKVDSENNYYFDFMLVVNENFNINKIYDYTFKTVKIESVIEIYQNDITFEFIEKIFSDRIITINNTGPSDDDNCYNISELSYKIEDYIYYIKNGSDIFDLEEYTNFNSFYFYERFNQNRCVRGCFRLLCSQIWTIDRIFFKEKNKHGIRIGYKQKYNIASPFLTNFAQILTCFSVNIDNNKNITTTQENYTYSSILDNLDDQGIMFVGFSEEYIINNKIDFKKLKIISSDDTSK